VTRDPNWEPAGTLPVSDPDWEPEGTRIPVREHSRTSRNAQEAQAEAIGMAAASEVRSQAGGRLAAMLPALGGLGGGLAGGIPGATIGGMVGKAVQLGPRGLRAAAGIRPWRKSVAAERANDLRDIARAGVEQGLLQTAGVGVAKVMGGAGTLAMRAALKADPRVARTAIQEGITASKWGLGKLKGKIVSSGAATANLIRQATKQGAELNPVQIAREIFQDLGPAATNRALPVPAQTILREQTEAFLRANPGSRITPTKLQAIKQSSDAVLSRYYAKLQPGKHVNPKELPIRLRWHLAVADRSRAALENIPGLGPQIAASNARTQSLIEVQGRLFPASQGLDAKLAQLALRHGTGAAIGGAIGAGQPGERGRNIALGALAGTAASSPFALSHIALLANNPMLAQMVRGAPHVGSALLAEP